MRDVTVLRSPAGAALEGKWLDNGLGYFIAGRGRRALVILNAYGQSPEFWHRFIPHVTDRFTVILCQARETSADDTETADAIPVDEHADDVLHVLNAEGIDKAYLLAWCTGPKTAIRLSASCPKRVASMALLAGCFLEWPERMSMATRYETTLHGLCRMVNQRPSLAPQVTEMMRNALFSAENRPAAQPLSEDPRVLSRRPLSDPARMIAYASQMLSFWNFRISPLLAAIETPTLFISGERDNITNPKLARETAGAMPCARHVEVAGGSHYLHVDAPALLAGLLERFVGAGLEFNPGQFAVRVERPVAMP